MTIGYGYDSVVTTKDIKQFVADWYVALDRHLPWPEIERMLDDEVRFVFPEATVDSHEQLRTWYEGVTRKFFDEVHRVDVADVDLRGENASVHVVVNWTTRIWNPPSATSEQLVYEADQEWVVAVEPGGRVLVRNYVVNNLRPCGNTPALG